MEREVKEGTDPHSPLRSNMVCLNNLMAIVHSFTSITSQASNWH